MRDMGSMLDGSGLATVLESGVEVRLFDKFETWLSPTRGGYL